MFYFIFIFRINLVGNMINLSIEDEKKLVYCYAVYFSKRIVPHHIRESAVDHFMTKKYLKLNNNEDEHVQLLNYVYNGTILFLPQKLTENIIKVKVLRIENT